MNSKLNTPDQDTQEKSVHLKHSEAESFFAQWTATQVQQGNSIVAVGDLLDTGKFWSIAVQSSVDTIFDVLIDDSGSVTTTDPVCRFDYRKQKNAEVIATLTQNILKELEPLLPSEAHINLGEAKSIFGRWSEYEFTKAKYLINRICNWRDYDKAWCVTVYTNCGVYDAIIYDNGSVQTYGFCSSENFRPLTHEQVLLFPAIRSPFASHYEYKTPKL